MKFFSRELGKSVYTLSYLELVRDISSFGTSLVLIFLALILSHPPRTIILLFLFLVLINAITAVIKLSFFKERPLKQTFKNIFEKTDAGSFPSAHAARATFASLVIFYPLTSELQVFAYVLPLAVSLSRIVLKKHDAVDVVVGILLGLFLYLYVFTKLL